MLGVSVRTPLPPSPPVAIRLKSVKNIEKITKSMKMVSAAKYGLAERELQPARTYGLGAVGNDGSCIDCSAS